MIRDPDGGDDIHFSEHAAMSPKAALRPHVHVQTKASDKHSKPSPEIKIPLPVLCIIWKSSVGVLSGTKISRSNLIPFHLAYQLLIQQLEEHREFKTVSIF
ncbi:hypothetical protein CEXT_33581 [Caerostris extrusa]|uniref:Uncharacterized protein n=1 Tax=Caerostris extrusa TaxID=172846 RepID=A0AAV4PTL8_CAEEX|nr:hypothetical protein CEXT_33581 [Caerostris extrusa]